MTEELCIEKAIYEIADKYGQKVSVSLKNKSLTKFGTNEVVGDAVQCTVMDLAGSETNETFVYSNLIDSLSTTDAGNTQEIIVEGHTIADKISVISITRIDTYVTVTTSIPHGLLKNDAVIIEDAGESAYNGRVRVIAVISDTVFMYNVVGSPTTPATGTITARPVKYTFKVQSVRANGTSAVLLNIPLATATRMYVNSSSPLVGTAYVYDNTGVALTAGTPDIDSKVHLIMKAGDDRTRKASTTISNIDYWIITELECTINKKTSAQVDIRVQIQNPYGTWQTVYNVISLSTTGNTNFQKSLTVPIVVPRNAHFRFSAIASTTGVQVSCGASGILATVIN